LVVLAGRDRPDRWDRGRRRARGIDAVVRDGISYIYVCGYMSGCPVIKEKTEFVVRGSRALLSSPPGDVGVSREPTHEDSRRLARGSPLPCLSPPRRTVVGSVVGTTLRLSFLRSLNRSLVFCLSGPPGLGTDTRHALPAWGAHDLVGSRLPQELSNV
jgi:hypothetical protein